MLDIKNKDFSVLEGRESRNKYGMKTRIDKVSYNNEFIVVEVYDTTGNHLCTDIHLSDVCNEYIEETLKGLGFSIKIIK